MWVLVMYDRKWSSFSSAMYILVPLTYFTFAPLPWSNKWWSFFPWCFYGMANWTYIFWNQEFVQLLPWRYSFFSGERWFIEITVWYEIFHLPLLHPTPPLHPSLSKPQKPNEREENKGKNKMKEKITVREKAEGGKEITNRFKSMTIYWEVNYRNQSFIPVSSRLPFLSSYISARV